MNIETIREFCISKPFVTEEFPFDSDTLVFKVHGKMFLLISLSNPSRFNVKCEPERAVHLREEYPNAIFPGYHMSKVHWNTVNVDQGLSDEFLFELMQLSYDLIWESLPKKLRSSLRQAQGSV